ncbi:hypothetical protein VSDG_04538 [Cytospora chrysosperma]|uniref:Uncharacterized protein n=1 Tax=Cytospora chrysosperma TaxID=252740 RepID=A0A423W2Q1_CYTCH|nr:hypothetical protein VSDG_04538 [Valsa sordida]
MKATLVAAALLGGASAHVHRRGHELFHKRGANDTEVCLPGCTTEYTTMTGQPTPNAPPMVKASSSAARASSAPATKVASTSAVSTPAVVPTPQVQTITTPGEFQLSRHQEYLSG